MSFQKAQIINWLILILDHLDIQNTNMIAVMKVIYAVSIHAVQPA